MYSLIRHRPAQELLVRQAPAFTAAFVLAEAYYRFHSFTLECAAFLATWCAFDAALDFASRLRRKG
jgi:hypothetical protein